MAERAQVTSVDAIETFRSALILYLAKAKPTLEEASSEVARTRQWLEHTQLTHWEGQMKTRKRTLERAQAELFSARMSKIQDATSVQELALHRAQRSIREAEDKLRIIRRWIKELENRTTPMVKLIEQLHGFMGTDLAKAVIHLGEIVKTLQAYASVSGGGSPAPLPVPSAPVETPAAENKEES